MRKEQKDKGFQPLYFYGILYVLLTYAYPVLWYLTLPKVDDTVHSDADYEAFAIAQNGPLGSDLPMIFAGIPLVLLIVSILLPFFMKKTESRYFLGAAKIIKYALIPYYLVGFLIIAVCILMMFTPVVIMVFVSPLIVMVLSVLGGISMLGSAPFVFAYLNRAGKDGMVGKGFSIGIKIMQFIFGLDVLGTIVCSLRAKKQK